MSCLTKEGRELFKKDMEKLPTGYLVEDMRLNEIYIQEYQSALKIQKAELRKRRKKQRERAENREQAREDLDRKVSKMD